MLLAGLWALHMIIGVDVDEVLAQLHDPWDEWILERYGITADWSSWHIDKTTGIGGEVFSFIAPEIYTDGTVKPFPQANLALSMLREAGHTIWYTTSCIRGTTEAKLDWLKGYGLWDNADEYKPGRDKNLPELGWLIDDGHHNCVAADCSAMLITAPWNVKQPYCPRAEDVLEAAERITEPDRFYFTQ